MPAQTVGARAIVSDHPIIKTIENAGRAFRDMGNLFDQTRKTRIYEKNVEYQHWQNRGQLLLNTYDRVAEVLDPQVAAARFAPLFEDLMVSGGMDRALFKDLSKKVANEELNWRVLFSRWLTEAYLHEPKEEEQNFKPEVAIKIVDEEIKRKREAEALAQVARETEVAREEGEAEAEVAPLVKPELIPAAEPRQILRPGVRGVPPVISRPPQAPYEQIGSALTPELMPGYREGVREAEGFFARGREQFRQQYGFELSLDNMPRIRKGIIDGSIDPKIIFPELSSTWSSRHEATLRLLLSGLEKNTPQTILKGLKIWAKLMYEEATP